VGPVRRLQGVLPVIGMGFARAELRYFQDRQYFLEKLYTVIWRMGVRTVHIGKRLGISGQFEGFVERIALWLVPVPREEVVVSIGAGAQLIVPPGLLRARTYASGVYEQKVTRVFQVLVARGMTVVDVGAFCGYYTLFASRLVGDLGRVYAFEAGPGNYSYLVRNTLANGCRNVTLVNKAISNKTGMGTLTLHKEADHCWLSTPGTTRSEATIAVKTVTLDDFFEAEGWPSIDVVKMDIEGSEKVSLEGMKELSRRNPRMQLIMEFDLTNILRAGTTREDLADTLQALGYRTGYVIEMDMKSFEVARGLPKTGISLNLLLKKD